MTTTEDLKPGTVVRGPFVTTPTDDYQQGVGIVQASRKRGILSVGPGYVPVKIIVGDRCSGGYRPESLTPVPQLKEA